MSLTGKIMKKEEFKGIFNEVYGEISKQFIYRRLEVSKERKAKDPEEKKDKVSKEKETKGSEVKEVGGLEEEKDKVS